MDRHTASKFIIGWVLGLVSVALVILILLNLPNIELGFLRPWLRPKLPTPTPTVVKSGVYYFGLKGPVSPGSAPDLVPKVKLPEFGKYRLSYDSGLETTDYLTNEAALKILDEAFPTYNLQKAVLVVGKFYDLREWGEAYNIYLSTNEASGFAKLTPGWWAEIYSWDADKGYYQRRDVLFKGQVDKLKDYLKQSNYISLVCSASNCYRASRLNVYLKTDLIKTRESSGISQFEPSVQKVSGAESNVYYMITGTVEKVNEQKNKVLVNTGSDIVTVTITDRVEYSQMNLRVYDELDILTHRQLRELKNASINNITVDNKIKIAARKITGNEYIANFVYLLKE